MVNPPSERPLILFLYSNTGGGHRSAAEAIVEALHLEYGDAIRTEMVDLLKEYGPPPFKWFPKLYPMMVREPRAWAVGFHLTDGSRRASLLSDSLWPYVRSAVHRMIIQHPCNMIVSLHPSANRPIRRAFGRNRPPFITVVTDLASAHALWYDPKVDLCLVPTEVARQRALHFGLKPEQTLVVGLPVAEGFNQPRQERQVVRERFGWMPDRPLILLMGGGEGMGPLKKIAQMIANSCPSASLAIVAGRNQSLKAQLEDMDWPIPTFIYGFVYEMPDFMHAADILVTKAGPSTISEALISGLPMVLYGRLPGQEDGNVAFVVAEGTGVWAPEPHQIIATIHNWLAHPELLAQVASQCRHLAHPQAARQIAHILADRLAVTAKG